MNRFPESLTLTSFDLLPASYRYRHRVAKLRRSWIMLIGLLIAIFAASAAASTYRVRVRNQRNLQLAMNALPLQGLRRDVRELQEKNERRTASCQLVESARPDDSALQTLAAIALASQNGDREVLVDSIELNLAAEYPASETTPPAWAQPRLTIVARSLAQSAAQRWRDRILQSDRVQQASVESKVALEDNARQLMKPGMVAVQIQATPVATGVLP